MEFVIPQATPTKHSPFDDYVPVIRSADGRKTTVYLTDEIADPSDYNQMCHILLDSVPGDIVTIKINNFGGRIDSGFQIIDAIKRTKATVNIELSGSVCSVATVITMFAHNLYIADYTSFMIHNYSSGARGKGHELKAYQEHTDRELNYAFREIYSGFLTTKEMTDVINGKDIWMGKAEILARWINKTNPVAQVAETTTPSKPLRGRPRKSEV